MKNQYRFIVTDYNPSESSRNEEQPKLRVVVYVLGMSGTCPEHDQFVS